MFVRRRFTSVSLMTVLSAMLLGCPLLAGIPAAKVFTVEGVISESTIDTYYKIAPSVPDMAKVGQPFTAKFRIDFTQLLENSDETWEYYPVELLEFNLQSLVLQGDPSPNLDEGKRAWNYLPNYEREEGISGVYESDGRRLFRVTSSDLYLQNMIPGDQVDMRLIAIIEESAGAETVIDVTAEGATVTEIAIE